MGKVFKWISRLVVAGILVLMILGAANWFMNKTQQPPDVEKAPWVIQTYSFDEMRIPSRVYYAEELTILEDGTPVVVGYWKYDGRKFTHINDEKEFPIDIYGEIGITKRPPQ